MVPDKCLYSKISNVSLLPSIINRKQLVKTICNTISLKFLIHPSSIYEKWNQQEENHSITPPINTIFLSQSPSSPVHEEKGTPWAKNPHILLMAVWLDIVIYDRSHLTCQTESHISLWNCIGWRRTRQFSTAQSRPFSPFQSTHCVNYFFF